MKKNIIRIVCVLIATISLSLLFVGCTLPSTGSEEGKVVTSSDGQSQITLPKGWTEMKGLNEVATIEVALVKSDAYFLDIPESKQDFAENTTLEEYADLIKGNFETTMENIQVTELPKTTINGYTAIQYKVFGEVSKIKVGYLYTMLETPNNFHQLVAWTMQGSFDKTKVELEKVVNSFKEIGSQPSPT